MDPALEVWTELFSTDDGIRGVTAVMYESDTVMKAGGTEFGDPTDAVYKYNVGISANQWTPIDSLNHERKLCHLAAMPDGKVMMVGGEIGPEEGANPVLTPEMYDPATDAWTDMVDHDDHRAAPSIAVLLPDGRVLVAGGQINESPFGIHTGEVFYPPYIFDAVGCVPRPVISSVITPGQPQDNIRYGTGFDISTPQATTIDQVRLMRLGANTHSWDFDARSQILKFVLRSATTLRVAAPAHGNVAPPGYYMIFIVEDGVPSVSRIIKLQ